MICPDDGDAFFWRVEDASGEIKNASYVVHLHKVCIEFLRIPLSPHSNCLTWISFFRDNDCEYSCNVQTLRSEIEAALPDGTFIGYIMDSTATNRSAMKTLQEEDPSICVIPCLAHCYSLVMKHCAKYFSWIDEVYSAVCAISDKVNGAPKLKHQLHELQKEEELSVRGILTHTPTRFGSKQLVLRSLLKSERAWRKMTATEVWRDALKAKGVSKAFTDAHSFLTSATRDLFERATLLEELMGPVMDAIHTIEADQPMLSFASGLFDSIRAHFERFATEYPELAEGAIPADKRAANSVEHAITLQESFERDAVFAHRPVMTAASIIDPLQWTKNSVGNYRVPVPDSKKGDLNSVLAGFVVDETVEDSLNQVESEVVGLECYSFHKSYTKALDTLIEKKRVDHGMATVITVQPHSRRIDFVANHNQFSEAFPIVVRAASVLLSMPISACSAERCWSKFGLLFASNRSALGLEVAQSLVFVQQNDEVARAGRKRARGADEDTDVFVGH
jgi:hypothetical protein